ncbi:hypothetical protein [Aquiflexum sp.]
MVYSTNVNYIQDVSFIYFLLVINNREAEALSKKDGTGGVILKDTGWV